MKDKIKTREQLRGILAEFRRNGRRIVFTNGCFDLIHPGHVRYLKKARSLGDLLVVALNSDSSVRRLKGPDRPLLPELERAEIVSAFACVDYVTFFSEETPEAIIRELVPTVLVKGGDWAPDQIIGRDIVESNGGEVVSVAFEEGFSTSRIIERIREIFGASSPS